MAWSVSEGGRIPGSDGVPAFVWRRKCLGKCLGQGLEQHSAPIPLIIAVPHAGRHYPAGLLAAMRQPELAARRLEDRLVDLIGLEVARATGATLLVAQAPRAMIDLNRAPDDIDREMIVPDPTVPVGRLMPRRGGAGAGIGGRAQGGLGLVPRRLAGLGEVWRGRLPAAELQARIEDVHVLYHAALADEHVAVARDWGAALLLDLHSMPPLPVRADGEPGGTFVLGDRFGASCATRLSGAAFAHLASCGVRVAHNRPYAGGYGLERHGRRDSGLHAMQLEIDRSLYLDAALAEPGEGMAGVIEIVSGLVRRLAGEVAALGQVASGRGAQTNQGWPRAAE